MHLLRCMSLAEMVLVRRICPHLRFLGGDFVGKSFSYG